MPASAAASATPPASVPPVPGASSAPRGRWPVIAWGLWDWGSAAFNAIVTTFVFTVYLTSGSFGTETEVSAVLGATLAGAGLVVALTAPVTGQRADRTGGRRRSLLLHTSIVVVMIALMFFVVPEPSALWIGLTLLAIATVAFEFASVTYNAMLLQVSTPATLGRVSGFGWGMGYVGGIVLIAILYFGLIQPETGLFGVTDAGALDIRVSLVIAAVWFAAFAIPVLFTVPDPPRDADRPAKVGVVESYRSLFRDLRSLWAQSRQTVFFLVASAVFRDGLTGVFTFGAVLAAGTFGFSTGDVLIFGLVANVVAGVATMAVGALDDRVGPKPVIVTSLIGLVVCGSAVFFLHDGGTTVFWIFGLALCLFVGPAQSASRSYLSRLIPVGREGELFGLYATTGKAATFLSPAAFGGFVAIAAAASPEGANVQYWGILGIVLVVAAGLVLLLPVKGVPPLAKRPRL